MIINESVTFLIIVAITVVIGLIIVTRFKDLSKIKRFELIVSYFSGMAVLLITYNIFITIRFNKDLEQSQIAHNTLENIQTNFLDPQKEILHYYPESYFLYATMQPDTTLSSKEPKEYDPIKRQHVEAYCSQRIFQSMEDFLSIHHYNSEGLYVWINSFLGWMQSPILQEQWQILKFNYAQDTRELVEEIIYGAKLLHDLRKEKGTLDTQDYDMISKNFKTKTLSSRFAIQ